MTQRYITRWIDIVYIANSIWTIEYTNKYLIHYWWEVSPRILQIMPYGVFFSRLIHSTWFPIEYRNNFTHNQVTFLLNTFKIFFSLTGIVIFKNYIDDIKKEAINIIQAYKRKNNITGRTDRNKRNLSFVCYGTFHVAEEISWKGVRMWRKIFFEDNGLNFKYLVK